MKFTMSTEKLKGMVSRVSKGVGNNKLIPLTSLMAIELKDSVLTLVTTDATNYLFIREEKVVGDDLYVVVDANVFLKLVSKMTSDNITLNLKPDVQILEVKGNGTYKIELPLDENGQLIHFPNPIPEDVNDIGTINRSTVQVILETIKPALAVTLENPQYTGYYVKDKVVATDTYKIACVNIPVFASAKLISEELMDLLYVNTEEKISVAENDNTVVFDTKDCTIVGHYMEGIEDYAIDAISELIDLDIDSHCSIAKSEIMALLDRLSLFVGPYDKNAIQLTFTKNGLQVSSKAENGVEIIPYISSDNFVDYTCQIDIQMLTQEVKAIQSDAIELYYGDDNAIKMKDGNVTIVVALLDDEDATI